MTRKEIFILIAIMAIVLIMPALLFTQASECNKEGGDFVRGIIWYKCIK